MTTKVKWQDCQCEQAEFCYPCEQKGMHYPWDCGLCDDYPMGDFERMGKAMDDLRHTIVTEVFAPVLMPVVRFLDNLIRRIQVWKSNP